MYWPDIGSIFRELFAYLGDRFRDEPLLGFFERPNCRLALWIAVGTIPIAVVGLTLQRLIEPLFASSLAVGFTLMVTGTVLWLTSRLKVSKKNTEKMGIRDAIWVGVVQAFALIPGISRSGVTVSAGLFRELDRELSARFSFLLMIPATIGALGAPFLSSGGHEILISQNFLLGAFAAFLTGYVALRLLLGVIRRGRFYRFAYYCWAVGGLTLIFSLLS